MTPRDNWVDDMSWPSHRLAYTSDDVWDKRPTTPPQHERPAMPLLWEGDQA